MSGPLPTANREPLRNDMCLRGQLKRHLIRCRLYSRCCLENTPHFAAPVLLDREPLMVPGIADDSERAGDWAGSILRDVDRPPVQAAGGVDQDEGVIGVVVRLGDVARDARLFEVMARQHGVFETISDTGLPDIRGTELPTAIVARFPRLVDCADTLRMNLIVAL